MIDSWMGINLVWMYSNYNDVILTFYFSPYFSCNLLKYWIKNLFIDIYIYYFLLYFNILNLLLFLF